jgi:hypothetical protein
MNKSGSSVVKVRHLDSNADQSMLDMLARVCAPVLAHDFSPSMPLPPINNYDDISLLQTAIVSKAFNEQIAIIKSHFFQRDYQSGKMALSC